MSAPHRASTNYAQFRELFRRSRRIVALTGAGVSAESGVPTFRGAGGLWRQHSAINLANPRAFAADPALVWQFYEYRRQMVASKTPNMAHKTLAYLEKQMRENAQNGRSLSIVTQNIDDLHHRAGSHRVVQLHGSLYKTRCTKCDAIEPNRTIPITEALADISSFDDAKSRERHAKIAANVRRYLPYCKRCHAMLRPHIVWFGESLEPAVLTEARQLLDQCDLLLVIGTSSIVYPAAMFAPQVSARGVPVAEFNLEPTAATTHSIDDAGYDNDNKDTGEPLHYFFAGPCGETLPKATGVDAQNELSSEPIPFKKKLQYHRKRVWSKWSRTCEAKWKQRDSNQFE